MNFNIRRELNSPSFPLHNTKSEAGALSDSLFYIHTSLSKETRRNEIKGKRTNSPA
jgi:hypothetical protein